MSSSDAHHEPHAHDHEDDHVADFEFRLDHARKYRDEPGVKDCSDKTLKFLRDWNLIGAGRHSSKSDDDSTTSPLRVLDFGCGPGLNCVAMLHEGEADEAVAADVSEGMLTVCQELAEEKGVAAKLSTLVLKEKDGTDLIDPRHTGAYDVVLITFVLGHVREEQFEKIMDALCQCVRCGGSLVVAEMESIDNERWRKDKEKKGEAGHDDNKHFHSVITVSMLHTAMRRNGLMVDEERVGRFTMMHSDHSTHDANADDPGGHHHDHNDHGNEDSHGHDHGGHHGHNHHGHDHDHAHGHAHDDNRKECDTPVMVVCGTSNNRMRRGMLKTQRA